MKQNQNFDHNHSQKVLSCHYNMDTNRVEARFEDGTTLSIDCISIEDEYGNTPAQRAELDWLLYNKPLEYVQLVLSGEIEHYLSLATVYKGNIIKNLIMDCQSYTKYRPNETTGGIFVSWRRKEELPTGA
jgi:hypothetical protein